MTMLNHVGALLVAITLIPVTAGAQSITPSAASPTQASPEWAAARASAVGSWRGRDPVWNGLAIGAIAGGLGLAAVMHSVSQGTTSGEYFFVGLGIGGGIGAGIDALLDRGPGGLTAPKPPSRIRISPMLSRQRKGAVAQVSF